MDAKDSVLSVQTWEKRKKELLSSIDVLMYGNDVDKEVLKIMKELVGSVVVRHREDYITTGDGNDKEMDFKGRKNSY